METGTKETYKSVIKINGVPILPPVITPELRKELLKYKHQAIRLEQRLKNCRDLKKHLDELLEAQNETISRPFSQLTFSDNSHIEALNITDQPKTQKEYNKPKLSRDIIEVSQYNDEGLKTICSNIKLSTPDDFKSETFFCDSDKTDHDKTYATEGAENVNFDYTTVNVNQDIVSGNSDIPNDNTVNRATSPQKPRLIRSNSYTLESPSPILLAHMQKTSCTDSNTVNTLTKNWTSLENNHAPFEESDFGSIDTVYHNDNSKINKINNQSKPSSPEKHGQLIKEVKSPTIEVYQTDISVQQITVNTSAENGLTKEEKTEKFLLKNPFEIFEPDSELLNVLKDIPETYANQIIELLKTQHLEQKERLERYDNLAGSPEKICLESDVFRSQSGSEQVKSKDNVESAQLNGYSTFVKSSSKCDNLIDLTSKIIENTEKSTDRNNKDSLRPHTTESDCTNFDNIHSERMTRSSTFSMSPSQSLYYSVTSDIDSQPAMVSPSIKIIDLESNNDEEFEIGVLRENNGYWEGLMIHKNAKNVDCSRELFPEIDPVTMNAIKREWAASIIGAYTKGYLTRRLLKTDKVQSLIATVKDVLLCAVELHHSDNIDEKDVELHRRLINQLSAALYAFHDTFFDLSIPEQMLIIAADRQRKIEKLKRPQSGKSSSRSVSSNKSVNSSRSNKSLSSNNRSSSKHKLISGSPSLTKV